MTTSTVRCAVCLRREQTTGLLCDPDLDRLSRHLDPANAGQPFNPERPGDPVRPPSIPRLYREFAALSDEDRHANTAQLATEHAEHAAADEHAISLRDVRTVPDPLGPDDRERGPRSVLAVLWTWARMASEERRDIHGAPEALPELARPPWVEVVRDGRTVRIPAAVEAPDVQAVEALCRWLHARLEWLAAQPWCDELVTDLRAVTASLRAGQGDPGARPIGPCTGLIDGDGEPVDAPDAVADEVDVWQCGAPLFMPQVGPRAPDEPLALPAVRCPACGARWSGLDLLEFARDREVAQETEKESA